jgi:hypothetical protein
MNSLTRINAPHQMGVDLSPNDGDIALVSINDLGTPGRLNTLVLKSYGYKETDLPTEAVLKHGFGSLSSEEGKPILFVVTINGGTVSENLRTNLYNTLLEFRGWLNGKKVWIPLMGTGEGGLSFEESYRITVEVINEFLKDAPTEMTLFLSFPKNNESLRLLNRINEVSVSFETSHRTIGFTGNYFIGGATWERDNDQSERFFRDGIWENGYKDKFTEVVKRAKDGDILFLKSTYTARGVSYLRLKGIGVIIQNPGDGIHLQVDWKITHELINLGGMGKYRSTFARVMPNDVQTLLNAFGNDKIIDSGLFESTIDNNERVEETKNYAELLADDTDGADLLEIGKDINAFAQVIAAASFKPPLAIALFGKWGSGKSFFMNQLRLRIDRLTNISDPGSPYCNGISQIHFNAWSYLDSNLWAGIVTRIFEGLSEYISNDTKANEHRREIGAVLSKELNVTTEEVLLLEKQQKTIQGEIYVLEKEKERLNGQLEENIKIIEKKTLKDIVSKVDDAFKIDEKIEEALNSNPSVKLTTTELKKIIPEIYWNNPRELYDQLRSTKIFWTELFRGKNLIIKIFIVIIVLVALLITPSILKNSVEFLKNTDFRILQVVLSLLIPLTAIGTRVLTTYRKLQPLLASFWSIRNEYEKQLHEAVFAFEQQEKALKIQIEQTRQELETLAVNIQVAEAVKSKLEFKIEHALATEALYSFIDKKSNGEDYQKYTGIVSLIRSDFKILNELFLEKKKEDIKWKDFREHFDKPLQRIVLYIDDLDRCPEEQVVQVLEAVNLLMAFPLFVVVVGVDPRWVKNALLLKYEWQFNEQNKEHLKNKGYKPIECSDYLEKIFQVPFHLKEASNEEVKIMLRKLSEPKGGNLNKDDEMGGDNEMEDDTEAATVQLGQAQFGNFQLGQKTHRKKNKPALKHPTSFELTTREIELIQEFSALIGNNPRAIKRFINVYQIVRAHEELVLEGEDHDYVAIMFFLALSVGPLKSLTNDLLDYIEKTENREKSPHAYLVHQANRTNIPEDFKEKLVRIMDQSPVTSKTKIPFLKKHAHFIQRFTFEDTL